DKQVLTCKLLIGNTEAKHGNRAWSGAGCVSGRWTMTQELAAVPGEAGQQRRLSDAVTRVVAAVVELADACAQPQGHPLIEAIVADPPAEPGLVARLARSAGWPLPARVAVAVLDGPPRAPFPASPAGLLADLAGPEPRLVLPDPDGPGRGALIEATLRRYSQGRPAAIGPAVPLAAAARSLRWARQALGLARRGIIAADGPVRAADHLSTLLLLADEDLARTLLGGYLTPLARLRPGQIQELFGDQLRDPDRRLDLQLALRARDLLGVPLAE